MKKEEKPKDDRPRARLKTALNLLARARRKRDKAEKAEKKKDVKFSF